MEGTKQAVGAVETRIN